MAPHKAIVEIPRFLYARVPASTTIFTYTTSRKLIEAPETVRKRRYTVSVARPTKQHEQFTLGQPVKPAPSVTLPSRSNYAQRARPCSTPTAPLRYNGTYANTYAIAKRAFSSTRAQNKTHHFDTLKFVQRLKEEGFNETQAVAMMRVLNSVIEESIQNLTRTMVLKEDAERSTYTQKVDFAKLRSELANADSSEIQLTKTSHEKLSSDLAKLSARLRDEINRTQASVRLDLNLEKGRIREEATSQDMRIKDTEARIEQEVASLRERVEAVKFSTLQWLMGVCTGTAALILGAWRLLM